LTSNYQERRRVAALEQQQSARSKAIDSRRRHLDDLALIADLPLQQDSIPTSSGDLHDNIQMPSTSSITTPKEQPGTTRTSSTDETEEQHQRQQQKDLRQHWASQLMNPEWLIEIPRDLATEWYVLPRPEGQRCTVLASKGRTTARLRNGIIFENFQSGLPCGSRETTGGGGGQGNYSLLDCIYHAPTNTYYILGKGFLFNNSNPAAVFSFLFKILYLNLLILFCSTDMMIWRGHELYDCTTEFRFFWMHSKLEEEKTNLQAHDKKILPLPAYPSTPSGIQAAYYDPVPFTRDGVYFIHRRTHYSPGQTPLALTWKDAFSSKYFIDTDAQGIVHPEQQVVLQYAETPTRAVCTGDEPMIPLGSMPQQFVEKVGGKLKPGRLLKFNLGVGGVEFSTFETMKEGDTSSKSGQEVHPIGADLKFIGIANQRRGRADTLSKILFQMMARREPITIDMLKAAAVESELGLRDGGSNTQGGESIGVVENCEYNEDIRMNDY
jgi:snurportin-1